jgi:uncharacterized membrane protein
MKRTLAALTKTVLTGLLIIVPIYLAVLLLLKGMSSVVGLVRPLAMLLPESVPAEKLLSLLFILVICFLVGVAVRTRAGQVTRERIEKILTDRLPGYALIRSLTQRVAGKSLEKAWKPALVEIEDALVPAFIIEEFEDGRYTVFVPSVPTPLAGAVYILDSNRVHPLDVPFVEAIKVVSRWGSGAKELVRRWNEGKSLVTQESVTGGYGLKHRCRILLTTFGPTTANVERLESLLASFWEALQIMSVLLKSPEMLEYQPTEYY